MNHEFIFSGNLVNFRQQVISYLKEILENEMGIKVRKSRFIFNKHLYPIEVSFFENRKLWGCFDPNLWEIGLNIKVFSETSHVFLKNILRHELAHYILFLKYENQIADHGKVFKEFCHSLGWSEEVSRASIEAPPEFKESKKKIVDKVQKLLSLSSSQNIYESSLALKKAKELLIQHQIQNHETIDNLKPFYIRRLLPFKRRTSKVQALMKLLKTFPLTAIYRYGQNIHFVEAIGPTATLEIAEYSLNFFSQELERLWKKEKAQSKLAGVRDKNSFLKGVAEAYFQKTEIKNQSMDLISIELQAQLKILYPKLASSKSHQRMSQKGYNLGHRAGQNLKIPQALKGEPYDSQRTKYLESPTS